MNLNEYMTRDTVEIAVYALLGISPIRYCSIGQKNELVIMAVYVKDQLPDPGKFRLVITDQQGEDQIFPLLFNVGPDSFARTYIQEKKNMLRLKQELQNGTERT
jgi:hypothetical protein